MIVPNDYQKLKALPEDPEGCITYGKQTEGALCLVSVIPIKPSEAMDFSGRDDLIHGIHRTLAKNQALIEVDAGKLDSGKQFIYSVIKTKQENGIQYFLLMHIMERGYVTAVRAFFDEMGTTGIRDVTIYEAYRRKWPDFSMNDWFHDPYVEDLLADFLMNLSEQEQFDEYFPQHPLSQCRQLIKFIKENQ